MLKLNKLPDEERVRPLRYMRVPGTFVVVIDLIIIGLIEVLGSLIAFGVDDGTKEIVARRFVDIVVD